ncbi:exosome complex exonuclease RRP44 [Aplysia californica]|uniref:Exosome complex exonuclease RRP44 n=1 Tax=Aplysia californica TaxID=6500 RepID=A0ABM0K0A8_APLCA|nr:exosome complex exonuclease RRP44 [Aplysia californica]
MLTNKVFIKKTKSGGVMKIVREHYLRDDISCGSPACDKDCEALDRYPLEEKPISDSKLVPVPHYIVPDTNVVLHQIDILEDPSVKNVIILQIVLDEIRHRSAPIYKRVKDMLCNSAKCFYTYCNEFNMHTYVERKPKESANDRNDRAIRKAVGWYADHLIKAGIEVVLLTNDADNRKQAVAEDLMAFTVHDYVKSLSNQSLIDRLANPLNQSSDFGGKTLFPEHLGLAEIQKGIRSGKYLQGTLLISRENYLEANVSVRDQENMVFVQGLYNLNRAVNDDNVVIEMLPEAEWSCPSSMVMREDDAKDEEDEANESMTDTETLIRNKVPKELRQPTGHVVGIIKRNWRQYCGILQPSVIMERTRHLFIPAEKRIPKIRIETRQAQTLMSKRIIVAIDSWPRNSRYPLGHFVRCLGEVGDKDTENEVLLLEHDVPHANFSEAVLSFLPKMPWTITEEEEKRRRDLRHLDICSVDPPGCTDIDDALHCRELENGNYEVGVHIADVSHFIRPGNALDQEAANRGTTVYLTDKRIDMVPDLLSSNLCSLRCDVFRFAFSVIWEMTKDADIVKTDFTKSIILSKASLTYAQAQIRIDDQNDHGNLTKSLRGLNSLAKILKKKRLDNGALSLASTEVRFHVDSETHDPIDVQTKELRETNSMVEEFMLLANVAVAEKILHEFPDNALLRRHPSPPSSNFGPVIKAAESKGFEIDVSSGKALADSLDKAVVPENPYFNIMLRIMTTRCMMQAVYFCSGMLQPSDYMHYGLAAPVYTHFTSPIRRYSDIIAHRLLAVSIGADSSYQDLLDKSKIQKVCNNLNFRHKMAQYAGRASVNLHTHLFFKKRIQDEEGYVLFVRKNALQVLIPKYGLEGTVFLNDENKKSSSIFVYNEEESTQTAGDVIFHVFDPVIVQLSIDRSNVQHMKLSLKLVKPQVPGFSVPSASESSEQQEMDTSSGTSLSSKSNADVGKPPQKKKKKR